MTRLLITGGLILALLAANIWQYYRVQDQAERAAYAEQIAADRLSAIQQLQLLADEREQARQALAAAQRALAAELSARELTIKELQRENDEYRDWADRPLPAITRRLRERPAITGAGDYQRWLLSNTDALHSAGDSTDPERGSD